MTVSLVQEMTGSATSDGTNAVISDGGISSFVANNLVVLCVGSTDARHVFGTVTDDGTGSWIELGDSGTSGSYTDPHLLMYYKIAAGDETAITIGHGVTLNYDILEFSGLTTTSPLDAVSAAVRDAATVSPSETATVGGLGIVGLQNGKYSASSTTFTGLDSGYLPDGTSINGQRHKLAASWKETVVGVTNPSGTLTDGKIAHCLALFKGAGGSSGPGPALALQGFPA